MKRLQVVALCRDTAGGTVTAAEPKVLINGVSSIKKAALMTARIIAPSYQYIGFDSATETFSLTSPGATIALRLFDLEIGSLPLVDLQLFSTTLQLARQ